MGMTIEEIQQGLKEYHNGFTGCAGNFQEVVDGALDIVCRYQKIEQIYQKFNEVNFSYNQAMRKIINVIESEELDEY